MLAFGMKASDAARFTNGQKIQVEGRVRLVGNEPFARFVISATNGIDFYLPASMKKTDELYIGLEVKARGCVYIIKRETADHKYILYEAHLSNAVMQALNGNSRNMLNRRLQDIVK